MAQLAGFSPGRHAPRSALLEEDDYDHIEGPLDGSGPTGSAVPRGHMRDEEPHTGREVYDKDRSEQCALLGGHADVASSPETQEALKSFGQVSLAAGQTGLGVAATGFFALRDYIQQGPKALSTLCFAGGLGTSCTGVLHLLGFASTGTLWSPFGFLLNIYMLLFGLATVVLEADTERLPPFSVMQDLIPHVLQAQLWLHKKVMLLTELHGRGLFYLYQGMLLVTQGCSACLLFLAGACNIIMGALCLATAYEVAKTRHDQAEPMDEEAGGFEAHPQSQRVFAPRPAKPVQEEAFAQAQDRYEQLKKSIKGRLQFELYGLLQQATVGDCSGKRPSGILNSSAKARWDAWRQLKGMSQTNAKAAFVEHLERANVGA